VCRESAAEAGSEAIGQQGAVDMSLVSSVDMASIRSSLHTAYTDTSSGVFVNCTLWTVLLTSCSKELTVIMISVVSKKLAV